MTEAEEIDGRRIKGPYINTNNSIHKYCVHILLCESNIKVSIIKDNNENGDIYTFQTCLKKSEHQDTIGRAY